MKIYHTNRTDIFHDFELRSYVSLWSNILGICTAKGTSMKLRRTPVLEEVMTDICCLIPDYHRAQGTPKEIYSVSLVPVEAP